MNKVFLILFPLVILLFCAGMNGSLASQVTVPGQPAQQSGGYWIQSSPPIYFNPNTNESSLINVSGTTVQTQQFIILISIFIGIAVLASIHVLGSGISGSSIPIIFIGGVLVTIWTVISLLGAQPLLDIPLGLGNMIYIILGVAYTVGIVSFIPPGGD